MTWEAASALASIVSAAVVLGAAIAAFIQLRHLRLANQLQCYLEVTNALQSPELVAARKYVEETNFHDPKTLHAAISPEIDPRIVMVGVHFQQIARLINMNILDEAMFIGYISISPRIWAALQPVAQALREREGMPRWLDLEYLVYRTRRDRLMIKQLKAYPNDFLETANLQRYFEQNQRMAAEPLQSNAENA